MHRSEQPILPGLYCGLRDGPRMCSNARLGRTVPRYPLNRPGDLSRLCSHTARAAAHPSLSRRRSCFAADLPRLKIRRERTLIDVELMSRRMSVSAVISLLRDRHGEATACKMARLEQLKARRARSRKRFDFWTAVATQMQQGRLDCEPAQNSSWSRAVRSTLTE